MKTVLVAFLDKDFPPEHSFVDDMLSSLVPRKGLVGVRLYVSGRNARPTRYRNAACLPILLERKGIKRFFNFFKVFFCLLYQIRREKKKGNSVVVFVRNDPVYLAAAALLRYKFDRLIFQSSFPHEQVSRVFIKRFIALSMYRFSSSSVDAITAVSPAGLCRVSRIFPEAMCKYFIPLLLNPSMLQFDSKIEGEKVTFIYIGTHAKEREIELVLRSIITAFKKESGMEFVFLGGSKGDVSRLEKVQGLSVYIDSGSVRFEGKVPRSSVGTYLARADIGLCLIPSSPIYYEASPTKLAEYLGAGLAVLASKGIALQEEIMLESRAGILVNWDEFEIAESILKMVRDKQHLVEMKRRAAIYANENLLYSSYLARFDELIGLRKSPEFI